MRLTWPLFLRIEQRWHRLQTFETIIEAFHKTIYANIITVYMFWSDLLQFCDIMAEEDTC